jgi:hypothetical protein
VRRSHKQTLRDRIMSFFGMVPYRCRDCQKRFFVSIATDVSLKRDRQRTRQASTQFAADNEVH